MTADQLLALLENSGTGKSKIALLRDRLKDRPNAGPADVFAAIESLINDCNAQRITEVRMSEATLVKAKAIADGTYETPDGPEEDRDLYRRRAASVTG